MRDLEEGTVLFKPPYHLEKCNRNAILMDSELPNWMATDSRGVEILGHLREGSPEKIVVLTP